jgi:uncharacterized 2Fe-2S/4Fe-4S cluster protein (DUF4445 family)
VLTVKDTSPEVIFTGSDISVKANAEETLLSCIRRAGLAVDSTCNGRGVCGKCRVTVHGEMTPPDEKELALLAGLPADVRLACMTRVLGKVSVTLDDRWTRLSSVEAMLGEQGAPDSPVKRIALQEVEPRSSRPYAEEFSGRVAGPSVLNKIATWDRTKSTASGVAFGNEMLDVRFGDEPLLGAAVDLGTTTLSLYVFNLETGELVGKSSALNPQTAYGGDVITRIGYCRHTPDGVRVLAAAVTKELQAMMDEALGPNSMQDQVYLMTVAGNSTMLHLLVRVQPLSLALAPFRPVFLRSLVLSGEESGMPINPLGRCILLPGASAYVGADIVAGLIPIGYERRTGLTLFIDIGTNGEMVLVEGPDRLLGTSCAVGPALEGMNISCGCRAVPGAIDSFNLDDRSAPTFTTIGAAPPIGICGSGLIDLVAVLVQEGIISPSGAFNREAGSPLSARLDGDRYHVTETVVLTQKDVRQVQLAKGAVWSGIMTLLQEAGHAVTDLDEIIVAGSFGYHLKGENLRSIGLLPKEFTGKVSFAGNSSLSGASMALLNQHVWEDMEQIPARMNILELGSNPAFRSHFLESLHF